MLHVRICSIRSRIAILRSWWFCLLSMSGAWEPLRLASPGSDADSSARQLGGGDAALGCICCQVSWDSSIKEQLSAWEQVRSLKLRDACCRTPLALSLHFPSFLSMVSQSTSTKAEESGQTYYLNESEGKSMWEHPPAVYLPIQFMRLGIALRSLSAGLGGRSS